VSQAVLGTHRFDDALEVIAEQTLAALDAASFSISRWDRERGVLHTVINVGDLGPGEERWPTDEEYPLADYRYVTDLLRQGLPYVNTLDDDDIDPADESLLRRLNKYSDLAVPVMYEGVMWGELWASGADRRCFGPDDIRLLEAIAAQISVAIGKAELFSEVSRYAYQDPLTRLANRRRLDECLRGLREGEGHPTLLVCDLDGLKEVNDREGHTAGDALLRGVADVLSDVASAFRASLVARLGGDEFCVVLPAASLTEAERFAHAASGQIARELGNDVSVCWGAAAGDSATCTGHELIAAADAALLEAKRLGPGRLRLRTPVDGGLPAGVERRRASAPSGRRVTDDLIPRFVGLLDQVRPSTTAGRSRTACWRTEQCPQRRGLDHIRHHRRPDGHPRRPWCRKYAHPRFGAARGRTSRGCRLPACRISVHSSAQLGRSPRAAPSLPGSTCLARIPLK
jgi:diguanylate cyclase (GGDEF)-like protein